MEKTALQEISEKYIELPFDRFVDWLGRNRERLTTADRDAIVEAHKAGDPFNNIHDAEQYYETRYGK
jgi:hypothetical protein